MSRSTTVDRDPARELVDLVRNRSTGILSALRGKHRRLLCLERGQLVFVASNVIEEQLEEFLVQQGLLTLADRSRLHVEAKRAQKKFTQLVIEQECIEPVALRRAVAQRNRELLLSTLEWGDAQVSFDSGKPGLDGELTVPVSCLPLILDHARRHPRAIDEVRIGIGPPNTRPRLARRGQRKLQELELDRTAREVVDSSDGTRQVAEVVERVEAGEEAALRALYGLLLVGVLEPAEEDEVADRGAKDRVTRDEVLARIARSAAADHYAVLGLGADAGRPQIREAYYYLARRYHPDRFRSGELKNLLSQIEGYFAKVTEAYNTLFDPDLRKAYDEDLLSRAPGKEKEETLDTAYLAQENFARGKLLAQKRQYQDAVQFLENAIQLDPSKAQYHLELGRVLVLNPRRRQDAEDRLRHATTLDPSLVMGYLALGELFEKMSRTDEAVAVYREALRWDATDATARQRLRALGERA